MEMPQVDARDAIADYEASDNSVEVLTPDALAGDEDLSRFIL